MTPEGQILKSIMDYLAVKRIWAMRMNTGAVVSQYKGKTRFHRYGRPGCADILALVGGDPFGHDVWWIECKTEKGRQSEAQKAFQYEVEAENHHYLVARSIEDVERALRGC